MAVAEWKEERSEPEEKDVEDCPLGDDEVETYQETRSTPSNGRRASGASVSFSDRRNLRISSAIKDKNQ